jgi:hypothetical protein
MLGNTGATPVTFWFSPSVTLGRAVLNGRTPPSVEYQIHSRFLVLVQASPGNEETRKPNGTQTNLEMEPKILVADV